MVDLYANGFVVCPRRSYDTLSIGGRKRENFFATLERSLCGDALTRGAMDLHIKVAVSEIIILCPFSLFSGFFSVSSNKIP